MCDNLQAAPEPTARLTLHAPASNVSATIVAPTAISTPVLPPPPPAALAAAPLSSAPPGLPLPATADVPLQAESDPVQLSLEADSGSSVCEDGSASDYEDSSSGSDVDAMDFSKRFKVCAVYVCACLCACAVYVRACLL